MTIVLGKTRNIFFTAVACLFLAVFNSEALGATSEVSFGKLGDCACVDSKASLLHLGSIDSFDVTERGKEAAKLFLDSMETKSKESAKKAWDIYEKIIPSENFGGEYVALQWFMEYFMADEQERKTLLSDRYVTSYFDFLAQNEFSDLKEYVRLKYHLDNNKTLDSPAAQRKQRFYEDFILFNNPRRERWEQSSKIIEAIGLKAGDTVADVGSGPGYFAFRFSEIVGSAGHVYAIDNNKRHVEYIKQLNQKLNINNVTPIEARIDSFDIDQKVDHVFLCSLYHILYGYIREEHREPFIASIKKVLKDDGRLIVVDNSLVDDMTLPYHGPYIAKDLIIGQLKHFGFQLESVHQIIPQRYTLIFKLASKDSQIADNGKICPNTCIPINSRASLVNMGLADDHPTEGGKAADDLLFKALQTKDRDDFKAAREAYATLMRKENFGNEYGTFLWFCDYMLASAEDKPKLLGKYVDDFAKYFFANDFDNLKQYLKTKVATKKMPSDRPETESSEENKPAVSKDQMLFWFEMLVYNNPSRSTWGRIDEIIDFIVLKKGETVVDVGSGPGYFSFRFADIVGNEGKVIATETNKDHKDYVSSVARKYGLNVETVEAKLNNVNVPPNTADTIFLGSLYDAVYAYSMETVKDQFIASVKACLKPQGKLVILDHNHVDPPEIPYHGPQIDKRLIINQLKYYGFKLVSEKQIIPQGYVLIFQLADDGRSSGPQA
jgi:predicted methyltransferase